MHVVKFFGQKNVLLCLAVLFCSMVFAGSFGMNPDSNRSVVDNEMVADDKTAANIETEEVINSSAAISNATEAAEQTTAKEDAALQLLADIRVHSAAELMQMLSRVDRVFLQSEAPPENIQPVVFLLHGDEARTLFKSQYHQHKKVVDLAARLTAFGVVDIKVCERWAGNKGLDVSNLQPFVDTVPYAPAEQRRLLGEQGYVYF